MTKQLKSVYDASSQRDDKNRRAERLRHATKRLREGVNNLLDDADYRYWAKDADRELAAEEEADHWATFMMGKD